MYSRPRIVASRCLGFEACRYNGEEIEERFVTGLVEFADVITVCPEVGIGLGIPRDPIRVECGSERRLVQPSTGLDLTGRMEKFREQFVASLPKIDGFILKARSPSCGIADTKQVDAAGRIAGRGPGLFAEAVIREYPRAAVEDERRLASPRIRDRFLTRIFAMAEFRRVRRRGSRVALVGFHKERELLLSAWHRTATRELARIAAGRGSPTKESFDRYQEGMERAFSRIAPLAAQTTALLAVFDRARGVLTSRERARFLDELGRFESGELPRSAPVAILEAGTARLAAPDPEVRTFLEPYPRKLEAGSSTMRTFVGTWSAKTRKG